jgi:hypothetical protein
MDSLERRQASTVPARVLDTVLSTVPRATVCRETVGGGVLPAYQIPAAASAMTSSATIAFFTRTDLLALIACRRGEQAYNS